MAERPRRKYIDFITGRLVCKSTLRRRFLAVNDTVSSYSVDTRETFEELPGQITENSSETHINVVAPILNNSYDHENCSLPEESPIEEVSRLPAVQNSNESYFLENRNKFESNINSLRNWFIQSKITRSNGNKLLQILRNLDPTIFQTLPRDVRTLTSVPCGLEPEQLDNGHFVYFGIENILNNAFIKFLSDDCSIVRLSINVNGLPLFRSSRTEFWPTIGCVNNGDVFLISIFKGSGKPTNSNNYLRKFIDECIHLTNNGITIREKTYPFRLDKVICDAPAKSFILQTRGHTGFNSCTKCTVKGKRVNFTTCFPNINAPLRKTCTYNNHERDIRYHIGSTLLKDVPNFRIVEQVPLDYMHLVCGGVMKKLLNLWMGNLWNAPTKIFISSRLEEIGRNYCPVEFQRKPRSLNLFHYWKCTEFREFLLIIGPVVLFGMLPKKHLKHFLLLHCCMRILCRTHDAYSEGQSENLAFTRDNLRKFIVDGIQIYSEAFATHNVHNLLHLSDDVENYGNLDAFSSFKYENFLFKLKKLVKSGNEPLKQVINRYTELLSMEDDEVDDSYPSYDTPFLTSRNMNTQDLELPNEFSNYECFDKLKYKSYTLRSNNSKDSYCSLTCNRLIHIIAFLRDPQTFSAYIIGKQFLHTSPLYTEPISSENLGIYVVSNLESIPVIYDVNLLEVKCYFAPLSSSEKVLIKSMLKHKNKNSKIISKKPQISKNFPSSDFSINEYSEISVTDSNSEDDAAVVSTIPVAEISKVEVYKSPSIRSISLYPKSNNCPPSNFEDLIAKLDNLENRLEKIDSKLEKIDNNQEKLSKKVFQIFLSVNQVMNQKQVLQLSPSKSPRKSPKKKMLGISVLQKQLLLPICNLEQQIVVEKKLSEEDFKNEFMNFVKIVGRLYNSLSEEKQIRNIFGKIFGTIVSFYNMDGSHGKKCFKDTLIYSYIVDYIAEKSTQEFANKIVDQACRRWLKTQIEFCRNIKKKDKCVKNTCGNEVETTKNSNSNFCKIGENTAIDNENSNFEISNFVDNAVSDNGKNNCDLLNYVETNNINNVQFYDEKGNFLSPSEVEEMFNL